MPLDIGVGIFAALGVSHIFGVEPTVGLVVLGVFFALLPDLDILPFLWPTAYNHRSFLHYPLLYIPLSLLVAIFAGPLFGTLFAIGVYAHLIHDTIGLGWGIAWFAPISKRKILLFPEKGRRERYGWFMSWLPEEEALMRHGQSSEHWITHYYLRPSFIGVVEYTTLMAALVFLMWVW